MLPKQLKVAENYLQYLKPLPQHFDVSDLIDDSNELRKVHLTVMQRYLGKSIIYMCYLSFHAISSKYNGN